MPGSIGFPVAGIGDGAVRVRMIADADLPAVVTACQDPEIQRYTTVPWPYGDREARNWLRRGQLGAEAGSDLHLVVIDALSGELVGSVGLHGIDPASGRCAAGYWVAPGARGCGVARRALRLLCDYAFRELDVKRIELWIEPANHASRRVAEAAGFEPEGLMRSFMPVKGERRDMLLYARLAPGD